MLRLCWLPTLVLTVGTLTSSLSAAALSTLDNPCQGSDWRCLGNGVTIANISSGYADQPYCSLLPSGAWICTVTHNDKPEGSPGEKVYTVKSEDKGKSWSSLKPLEPDMSPLVEYAYSTILQQGNKLYLIYVENDQNVTSLPGVGHISRTDMLGHFFMRWSTDGGDTWSKERLHVPVNLTRIDRENEYKGKVQMMWLVDKGFVNSAGEAYFAFAKIGKYLVGPPTSSWVLYSPNLFSATDPHSVVWKTLPEGDDGVHNWEWDHPWPPGRGVAEEPHVVPLGDNKLYMVFRTTSGYLGGRMSHTSGASWVPLPPNDSKFAQYLDLAAIEGGLPKIGPTSLRRLKNPRGPTQMRFVPRNFLRGQNITGLLPSETGAYLLLFYFNSHVNSFLHRNPYWLSAGFLSQDGNQILWSEPEVVLYTADAKSRGAGYPDYILDPDVGVLITETNKVFARSHLVDQRLLQGLFSIRSICAEPDDVVARAAAGATAIRMPQLPSIKPGASTGFSIAMWGHISASRPMGIIFSNRAASTGAGIELSFAADASFVVSLHNSTSPDPVVRLNSSGCAATFDPSATDFIAVVMDGGAQVLSIFINGVLCDGGTIQAQGWATLPASGNFNGASEAHLSGFVSGEVFQGLTVFGRSLRTSEMVGYWRHIQQ